MVPDPGLDLYSLDTIRGQIVAIDVSGDARGAVAADGVVLHREGIRTRAAETTEIARLLEPLSSLDGREWEDAIEEVASTLAEQGATLEQIRAHQVESDSPLPRWTGYMLSGLVGALISLALSV